MTINSCFITAYYCHCYHCILIVESQTFLNNSAATNITCLDDFINLNNTCHARCDCWTTQQGNVVVVQRVSIFIAAITGLLGGFIFLVIAAVRHQHSYVNIINDIH